MLRKISRYLGAYGAIAGALVFCAPARAVTFNFDNAIGESNNFVLASGGETATFSSSSGPSTFTVGPSADVFSFPVALGDFGGKFDGDPLTITFSDPVVDRILIPFGIFEAYAVAPVTLVATTNSGEAVAFTTAFNNLISGSPEGVISFVPMGRVSSLTLMSSMAFAIASVEVPEPMSAALLGGGLILLALMRHRKR